MDTTSDKHTDTLIDTTRPVRAGEELDIPKLSEYLRGRLPGPKLDADIAPVLTVEQFPGGHSNLTYLVRTDEREYVLRRPPFGTQVATAHDMGREYRVLSKLSQVFPKAPMPVLYCPADEAEAILGAPFYLMERLRGVIVRRNPPAGLALDENTAERMSYALIDTLAELHAVDYQAVGLGDLGKPEGYVERQIRGWSKRYDKAQTDDIPSVAQLSKWLRERLPASDGASASATLIHNDFKFDNVVLDPTDCARIVGILDWEMATLGDPLMDVGTSLCYWVEAKDPPMLHEIRFGPTHLPGMLTRAQLVERYAEKSGRDVSDILYYYAYGLFKTAVVAQQIYYRYRRGHTTDKRFEKMLLGVKVLSQYALAVIARGTL